MNNPLPGQHSCPITPSGPSAPPPTLRVRFRMLHLPKFLFLLVAGLALAATSAHASHFRGASLTWKKLASPDNTVEVTVTESWRISPGNSYTWGDGTGGFSTSDATVIASGSDATGTFLIVRKVVTHTYSGAGPWSIVSNSGARIPFVNANQTGWNLQGVVDMRNGNQGSPVIQSPIVLQMVKGGVNSVPLSFADVDGDPVTFRMATTGTGGESGITSIASAGGHTLSVASDGTLSWNTVATSVGQYYAVQVIANDNHPLSPSGTGASRVFFDFMIRIVDGTLNRPPVATGNSGPFTLGMGQTFTNTIVGTDPDGGNLKVTHLGLPNGATLSPVSGTTGPQPLSATFSWTPTLADAGSSVGVTVVFADPSGLEATKSFTMTVVENQPPVARAGPDVSVIDTDANYQPNLISLDGSSSSDPESAPLTYSWTQIGGPPVSLALANTATPSFSAPVLQNQTPAALAFRLSVSDGKWVRTDDVIITVTHNNRPPTALATGPATAPEGTPVTLDGLSSNDPDNDTLTYTWTQTSGSPVSLAPNGTNHPLTQFTTGIGAPHSVLGEELIFTLTVSDGIYSSTSSTVRVFILNVNQPPIVKAGDDAVVFDTVGHVGIHGHSQDPDGDPLSFQWIQLAGPTVQLTHADEDHTQIVIPAVTPEQGSITLTFQLVAIDGNDAAALSTTSNPVNITVLHANRTPVADAGLSRSVPEQSVVTLDASDSYDPDQDAIASYFWTQISGTPVTLDLTNPKAPTFTAPDVNATGETLTFQLVVNDTPAAGTGASLTSAPSTVTITVTYVNRHPTAIASAPASIDEGSVVTLNGSATDPDGNATTLIWAQVSGPAITLSDATAATPTFIAPEVNRFGDAIVFSLIATDEFNASSAPATASVAIQNVNHAPIADASLTQSVPEDTLVNLAGLASDQDSEEQPLLTYAWTQTAGPSVALTGADELYPSFQAPIVTAGGDPEAMVTLKFKLTVTDPNNALATDDVEIIVANVDHTPIANAGGIIIANERAAVTLDGSLSNDPDGDTLAHTWVQTAGPDVVLTNANAATPTFTAPFVTAAGATLQFKLTVSDGYGGSSSDVATVNVRNANDPPTIAGASPSIAVLWPPNHKMVPISIAGVTDPNGNATITITGVTQDEPTNGLGDGDTAIDAIINPDGTVLLRTERSGKGDGRVYRVYYTASDLEGSVSGMVKVGVPHSKKTDAQKDSGGIFDSTL